MISNISYKKILFFVLLAGLVIFPRLWQLTSKPPLIVDEPANIRDIELILTRGLEITDFHWDYSKSRIVHVLPVLLIKLGMSDRLLALRLSSVILSTLSLIIFYYISRKITNKTLSIVTTLLFSSSYYFLEFSRVGWTDVILNVFLGLTTFFIIIKIKERKNYNYWLVAAAGTIASLVFYSYRSGIILIATAVIFLLDRINFKNPLRYLATAMIFIVTFIVLSIPWILKTNRNPDKYNLRLNVVSVSNKNFPFEGFNNKSELYKSQIGKTLNAWILLNKQYGGGSEDPRYLPQGFPIVNIFVKLVFWVGFLSGLFAIKKYYPLYIIIFMSLLGQIMTVDPPNGARGLLMLPCIYLLFGLGLNKIYDYSGRSKYFLIGLSVISAVYFLYDLTFYFNWMNWIKV